MLKTLKWNLSYPNPIHFLRRVSETDGYDVKAKTIGKYLLKFLCLEWRLLYAPHYLLVATAIWLMHLVRPGYIIHKCSQVFITYLFIRQTPNLACYLLYAESQLVPTVNIMLNYLLKPTEHKSFHEKYTGKKYLKVHKLANYPCLLVTHDPIQQSSI